MKKRVTALLLAVLLISLLTVPASAAETSWLWPVESCTSITPGRDYNGSEHNGIDIPGAYGAAIRASKSGTVDTVYSGCINHNAYSAGGRTCTSVGCTPNVNTYSGICNDGYGNGVIINHGDGTYSQYAHMSSTTVTVGQQVTQGDVIGYIGNSGAAAGAHLHFSLATSKYTQYNNSPSVISYVYSASPLTVPNAPTLNVNGSTVTFSWSPVSWTNQYRINVKNAGGAILNEWANVTSDSNPIQYTISNVADGSYYAYITAYKGNESRQSSGSAFTVSTQPTTYTVTLNADGGTINAGNITSYTYGIGATLPTDVTKTGYTFLGWFDGNTKVTAISTTDTGNKSYTAKWQPNTYNVTLNADGGTINAGNITSYTYGIGATLPTDVTKTGYTFLGWFDGNTKVTTIGTTDTGVKTYLAHWAANDSPVAVYAIVDGVTETQPIATVVPKYDTKVLPELNKLTAATLDRYGYDRAAGFFAANSDAIDTNTLAQTYDKVYVRYTSKLFTVTFRTDGGSSVSAQQVRYQKTASRPTDPTRDGYIFKGWLDETGRAFSFSTPITQNRTLTAKWEPDGRLLALAGLLGSDEDFPFYDVDANDWFYEAVRSAWEQELIDGVTARYFKPDSTLTVAQAVKLAAALHQKQSVGFVTLQNGGTHWYDNYVNYAVANGLIEAAYQGKSAEDMNKAVTRAEFVHILSKLLSTGAINTVNSIPDVKSGDAYANEIFAFYRAGILTGSDRLGTFHPTSSLKRSEAAAILVRLYDVSRRQYITLK